MGQIGHYSVPFLFAGVAIQHFYFSVGSPSIFKTTEVGISLQVVLNSCVVVVVMWLDSFLFFTWKWIAVVSVKSREEYFLVLQQTNIKPNLLTNRVALVTSITIRVKTNIEASVQISCIHN
ncbi:hypothetical protein V6N13_060297 [Hibiscus sabdariffa]|uniref:Uncharacterized protein n=1 Tax=Hibiscus sabdariffa TaxID=183260 RepID=A0ABR2GAG6_9ROSI